MASELEPCAGQRVAGLKKRQDYVRVQRAGRRRHRNTVSLLILPGRLPLARLGLTVSARVGKAIVRNRVKRRLRAIARERSSLLEAGIDYVVIAQPRAAQASYRDLDGDLTFLLAQAAAGWPRASR